MWRGGGGVTRSFKKYLSHNGFFKLAMVLYIYNVYTIYIQCIHNTYIQCIHNIYTMAFSKQFSCASKIESE